MTDATKTAEIIKMWYYPPPHRQSNT